MLGGGSSRHLCLSPPTAEEAEAQGIDQVTCLRSHGCQGPLRPHKQPL